ncbi:MAG: polysaccharide deacetylase family protein [Hyphomicrobiales bacterium]|nr:polysaccharide deacetylase family protein [Hyphomicrobiales bacterium]
MDADVRRERGMDHSLYAYETDAQRPAWVLPSQKKIAFFALLYIEHWELDPPPGAYRDPRFRGAYGDFAPDYWTWSYRLYGNRVGVHRVLRLLDRFEIPTTVAFNSMALDLYPELVDAVRARPGWEAVAHGVAATRMITARMSEDEERAHILRARDTMTAATGEPPRGWVGQDYGVTERTSRLLADAGFGYTLDWPNDERPYTQLSDGRLLAIPSQPDWDDVQTLWLRRVPVTRYPDLVAEAADELADGRPEGRLLGLGLHPWMIGAPHRIVYLRRALARLRERDDVWFATAGAIADQFRSQMSET